ncbi:MAG: exodeoxyribonuclease III [Deltaproteobacteria bacterium]|nr:exodeoxyribonuclease III [Deltaproteobacteria bacterium]MBW2394370.1 exodeoxyribonuclease III [Deltaproteobacteria bacterium]
MRIATWNVNGLRARLDFVLHWLAAREPDVVGLQELKLQDDQFPHDVFEQVGYQAVTHGQKAWNGVAILSRKPATLVQAGLPGQEDFGARMITAEVEGLRFTTVYCPNGKNTDHDDYPRKLAWFDTLADHLGAPAEPSVVCGDFNICPTALDSWNEAKFAGDIFHTDAERARMGRFAEQGWMDLFRALHPDEQAYSWWDYRGGSFHRGHGLRIDFVLGTAGVRDRTREVTIDRDYRKKQEGLTASDHAPVIAELA